MDVELEEECFPAIEAGGLTLKFCLLYRSCYPKSKEFRLALEYLARYFGDVEEEASGIAIYRSVSEFRGLLISAGFGRHRELPLPSDRWFIKTWDYLNANIQKKLDVDLEKLFESPMRFSF